MHVPIRLSLLASLLGLSGVAHAVFIVDTGLPTNTTTLYNLGANPGGDIGRAVSFTVSSATTLSAAEGYMQIFGGNTLTLSLYAGSPGGTPLFSTTGTVSPTASSAFGWYGLQGLNWNVAAGTYALAFTAPNLFANMAGAAPSPLGAEWSGFNGNWSRFDSMDLGIRISAVPEVSTAALLAAGLGGLFAPAARRRRLVAGKTSARA